MKTEGVDLTEREKGAMMKNVNEVENEQIFKSIDSVISEVDALVKKAGKEKEFHEEINCRLQRKNIAIENDNDVLRKLAELIAYSQGARSNLVDKMISGGIFEEVFQRFVLEKVANMKLESIKSNSWDKIKAIRFKGKISHVINCAKVLITIKSKYGSFADLLKKFDIPKNLESDLDIEKFWRGFHLLRSELKNENMPFFKQSTSLLHFLLEIGYDCVKPDSAVMKVAIDKLKIAKSINSMSDLIKTVRLIQLYGLHRNLKPVIVDLYFLIAGKQTSAIRKFL